MTARCPARRYDVVAIVFHWTVAATILLALPLGFLAAHAPDHRQAALLLRAHIPLGVLVLVLTVARAIWRYRHAPPPLSSGQPRWQAGLARISHALLYAVPIVLCASGIALLALSGAAPIVFAGVQAVLPDFSHFPPMAVHALAAFILIGLIGVHGGAVVYHQFYRRDRLLARMGIGSPASPSS